RDQNPRHSLYSSQRCRGSNVSKRTSMVGSPRQRWSGTTITISFHKLVRGIVSCGVSPKVAEVRPIALGQPPEVATDLFQDAMGSGVSDVFLETEDLEEHWRVPPSAPKIRGRAGSRPFSARRRWRSIFHSACHLWGAGHTRPFSRTYSMSAL